MSLTPHQRDLLLYIQRYQDANGGVSPSYDEMTAALGLASKSGIHRLMEGLEGRGFISRMHGRPRAITILKRVRDPDAPPVSDDGRDAYRALVREIARAPHVDPWGWRSRATTLLEKYP